MNENASNEIAACQSLLREIAELCENASLTGSLSGGAGRVGQRYNALLGRLTAQGAVPQDLFSPIPEGAGYGEIGVEARMLAGYLKQEKKKDKRSGDPGILVRLAPFVSREDLANLIRQHWEQGTGVDMDTITHLAPFLAQEDLGKLLSSHFQAHVASEKPEPPTPPAPPAAPAEAPTRPSGSEPTMHFNEAPRNPEDRLGVLLERLKDPRLSDAERLDLIERVRALTSG